MHAKQCMHSCYINVQAIAHFFIVFHIFSAVRQGHNASTMPAVPAHILPQLAEKQQFRCPYCHNIQNVNLAPEVAHQIMSKQRLEDLEKQNAESIAQQQRQSAEWARAASVAHQDDAALNQLAYGTGSHFYGQVLLRPPLNDRPQTVFTAQHMLLSQQALLLVSLCFPSTQTQPTHFGLPFCNLSKSGFSSTHKLQFPSVVLACRGPQNTSCLLCNFSSV